MRSGIDRILFALAGNLQSRGLSRMATAEVSGEMRGYLGRFAGDAYCLGLARGLECGLECGLDQAKAMDPFLKAVLGEMDRTKTGHYQGDRKQEHDFRAEVEKNCGGRPMSIVDLCVFTAGKYLRRVANTWNPVDLLKAVNYIRVAWHTVEKNKNVKPG